MKNLLAAVLIAAVPALALAQASPAAKTAATPAAKQAAKPAPKAKLAPSARKAVEENTPIDDDLSIKLTEADVEVSKKVYVGEIPCELGASVKITPMKREGMFMVTTKGHRFRMHPVESRTGAIRLEDPQRGAMWLQLGNKSMLMSQKLGQRLADECQSPAQLTYAESLKNKPLPSILEPLPAEAVVRPAAMPAAAASGAKTTN
jgi:Ni/Co efflux regulator RcnB